MKKIFILGLLCFNINVLADSFTFKSNGLKYAKSNYNVSTTADRLESILIQSGMTVFARIDHAAGAKSIGKHLPPTELIIFGNPNVGTLLMKCRRSVGIDLPLKALIYKFNSGDVLLAYNDPEYLDARHKLSPQCKNVVQNIRKALARFAQAATK